MTSRLNPRTQAAIALALILMLAGTLFAPIWWPNFKPEESVLQTVLTLAAVAVHHFLGTTSGSAAKDERAERERMAARILNQPPEPPK